MVSGSGADRPSTAIAGSSTRAASSGLDNAFVLPASAGVGGAGKGSQSAVGVPGKGNAVLTTASNVSVSAARHTTSVSRTPNWYKRSCYR